MALYPPIIDLICKFVNAYVKLCKELCCPNSGFKSRIKTNVNLLSTDTITKVSGIKNISFFSFVIPIRLCYTMCMNGRADGKTLAQQIYKPGLRARRGASVLFPGLFFARLKNA